MDTLPHGVLAALAGLLGGRRRLGHVHTLRGHLVIHGLLNVASVA